MTASADEPEPVAAPGGAPTRFAAVVPVATTLVSAGVVAELAVSLAGSGHDVLVLDWTSAPVDVRSYLRWLPARPLHEDELAEPLRKLRVGSGDAPDHPRLRHELSSFGVLDVLLVPEAVSDGTSVESRVKKAVLDLRTGRSRYSHVLLHGLQDDTPAGQDLIAGTVDVAVCLISAAPEAITVARDLAAGLRSRRAQAPLDLVVASADLGDSESAGAGSARRLIREMLTDLLRTHPDDAQSWMVELADDRGATARGELTVLGDADGPAGRSLRQVAGHLTGGTIPALPDRTRRNYVAVLRGDPRAPTYRLVYTPIDRHWADQVGHWLRSAGMRVARYRPQDDPAPEPGDIVLAVHSTAGHDQGLLDGLPDDAVEIVVDGDDRSRGARRRQVHLWATRPDRNRFELLSTLDLFVPPRNILVKGPVPQSTIDTARLPRVPTRDRRFTGRDDVLEKLRDRFAPLAGWAPGEVPDRQVTLAGVAGVGKSGLAAEYAHRFAGAYPAVLWIPARDARSIRAALTRLAIERGLATPSGPSAAALGYLARECGRGHPWLVVFDNVSGGVLREFKLDGIGDVLITTTSGYRPAGAELIELGPLSRIESQIILREPVLGLPDLTDEDADRVFDLVGGLPIPLKLAAAVLRDDADLLQREMVDALLAAAAAAEKLVVALTAEPGGSAGGEPGRAGSVLRLAIEGLARDGIGELAVRLAGLCANLSSDGVGVRLLTGRAFVTVLAEAGPAGRQLLADEQELDRVLARGTRFGLFTVDWAAPATVRMHRVVQDLLRARLTPDRRLAFQADTLRALATSAPLRPDDHQQMMGELEQHLHASGALDAAAHRGLDDLLGDPAVPGTHGWEVRRWVVQQLAHLQSDGEEASLGIALDLITGVERTWSQWFSEDDPLRARLVDRRGSVLYALGRVDEAWRVDTGLLARTQARFGGNHPRSVHAAGVVAGDALSLGRFEEALPEAEAVWLQLREMLGESHPLTLTKGYNLAVTRFVNGHQVAALELHELCHRHRGRVLRTTDPFWWWSLRMLGFFLRETGEYDRAIAVLEDATNVVAGQRNPQASDERLRIQHTLAVTRRRAGRLPAGNVVAGMEQQLQKFTLRLGGRNPEVLNVRMGLAVGRASAGETDLALAEAAAAVAGFRAAMAGASHPLIGVALANQALVQHESGLVDKAVATGREALAVLDAALDDVHPWWLTVESNLARALAATGEPAEARTQQESVSERCHVYLAEKHPVTVAADRGLEAARTGSVEGWPGLDIDLPPT